MCAYCDDVERGFKRAKLDPHKNLVPVYNLLADLIKRNQLKIYAGDCPFEEMLTVLDAERHYTVSFYLRCLKCKRIYFFGACIRGTPVYKFVENIGNERMDLVIWGKEGVYFR